ncbi:MAG: hypothetical protein J6C86_02290 [Bacteroidaceae bacterium]|nr:hypothetical protein [Bacteroidaceae bacterium]
MKYLRQTLLSIVMLFANFLSAEEVSLFSGDVKFEVPAGFVDEHIIDTIPDQIGMAYGADYATDDKSIVVFVYRKGDFSVPKVLGRMDSNMINLKNFKLIDTEEESIFNFTTNYVTRIYIREDGLRIATHTRYDSKSAYCFAFSYRNEEDFKEFENLINSIHFAEEDGFGQIKLAVEYTAGMMIILIVLLILISIIACAAGMEGDKSFVAKLINWITVIIGFLFLLPLWGFWIAYASLLVSVYAVCWLCALTKNYFFFGED